MSMVKFRLNGEGEEIVFDPTDVPFSEAVEIERQTKMGVAKYLTEINEGTNRATDTLFWVGAVKASMAATGASFRDAARALPYDTFRTTVNYGKTYETLRDLDQAPAKNPDGEGEADPTMPPPDGSTTPTSPGTFAAPSPPSPSPTPAPDTSDSSPTSSASSPGTGTA